MIYCSKCAAEVQGAVCANCGSPVEENSPRVKSALLEEHLAGLLCYLFGWLGSILFLGLPGYDENRAVRFHAFQSIFFNIAWIVAWIVLILTLRLAHPLLLMIPPVERWILGLLLSLSIWIGGIVLWIILMYKAFTKQHFSLPLIGRIAEKQM